MRIYIIGCPGSGKSTLARKIASELRIPWFETDSIAQPGTFETVTSFTTRKKEIEKIAQAQAWVAEGIYFSWTKVFLDKADLIIYLQRPIILSIFSVVWRYLYLRMRGIQKYRLRDQVRLPGWIIKYHLLKGNANDSADKAITKYKTEAVLKRYTKKLMVVKTVKQKQQLLFSLTTPSVSSQKRRLALVPQLSATLLFEQTHDPLAKLSNFVLNGEVLSTFIPL